MKERIPQNINSQLESFPLEMYNISGHGNVNPEKYLKDKTQDNLIMETAQSRSEIPKDIQEKIKIAPAEEQFKIIKEILEHVDLLVDLPNNIETVSMFRYLPIEKQAELETFIYEKIENYIERGGDTAESRIRYMINLISQEKKDKIRSLIYDKIRESLEEGNFDKQIKYMPMIEYAPEKEWAKIKLLIFEQVEESFQGGDIVTQQKASKMIRYVSMGEKEELENRVLKIIEKVLMTGDIEAQKKALEMIEFAPIDYRSELIKKAFEKGFGNSIIQSPLYKEHDNINTTNLRRETFDKSGSGLTLIGGPLKNKLVIRHIEPKAFISWQRIYEDYHFWKINGFDYVPIEPIQSYRLNKKELIDAYSGVLDLSLEMWHNKAGKLFFEELLSQKEKILKALDSFGFEHGHIHENNFALRFFRDEKGNPDLSKTPRLYLIDFDQAILL